MRTPRLITGAPCERFSNLLLFQDSPEIASLSAICRSGCLR